jgi:hypothetical protein
MIFQQERGFLMLLLNKLFGFEVLIETLEYDYFETMERWRERNNIVLSHRQKTDLKNKLDGTGKRNIEIHSVLENEKPEKKIVGSQKINFSGFNISFRMTEEMNYDNDHELLDEALDIPAAWMIMTPLEKIDRKIREHLTGLNTRVEESEIFHSFLFNTLDFLIGTDNRISILQKVHSSIADGLSIQGKHVSFSAADIKVLDKTSLTEIIKQEHLPVDVFRFRSESSLRDRVLHELAKKLLEGGLRL